MKRRRWELVCEWEPACVSASRMDRLASLQSVDRAQLPSHLANLLLAPVQWTPQIVVEVQRNGNLDTSAKGHLKLRFDD